MALGAQRRGWMSGQELHLRSRRTPRRTNRRTDGVSDVSTAVEAMSADELRTFVLDALRRLEDEPRAQLEDVLLQRAARGTTGWRPSVPSQTIVGEIERFVEATRHVGHADPTDVDKYLRQGVKASLAGDQPAARSILGALLASIAEAGVDLGQHEIVDEVLTVNMRDCAARYIVAVYCTTLPDDRADAVFKAMGTVDGLAYLSEPIAAMEGVAVDPLPQLTQFLPRWIERLERESIPAGEWETDRDRWLREAVARSEGLAGLDRLAHSSRQPEAVRAWCDAVVDEGDWSRALHAYEEAAELVTSAGWLGEFLDGVALAAQRLGRADTSKRFESAWRGAPSLGRLLRWLGADKASAATLKKRARSALKQCPTKSARLRGILHLIAGEVEPAAKLLGAAPGLGWSSEDHPGHLLFPAFVWLLNGAPNGSLRGGLPLAIDRPPATDFHNFEVVDRYDDAGSGQPEKPRLSTPSLVQVMQQAAISKGLTQEDRVVMRAALRTAATARVDGVLIEKRRRHYQHAAMLVGCCVDLADGRRATIGSGSGWVAALRQRTSRFPAFQEALRQALAQVKT
jgi:hypothetical protein